LSAILLVPPLPRSPFASPVPRFIAAHLRLFHVFPLSPSAPSYLLHTDIVVVVVRRLIFFAASFSGVTDAKTVTIRDEEKQRNTGILSTSVCEMSREYATGMDQCLLGMTETRIIHDPSQIHRKIHRTRGKNAFASRCLDGNSMFLDARANFAVSDGITIYLATSGSWLCKK